MHLFSCNLGQQPRRGTGTTAAECNTTTRWHRPSWLQVLARRKQCPTTARAQEHRAVPGPTALVESHATAHDPELQRFLLAGPAPDFDFRAETTACTREWVDEHAPQLQDLVDDGTLVVVPRRPDYRERRSDGYTEPGVVLLVGTAHFSRRSQRDVDRVIRAVRPDSVVVELCKGRSAALAAPGLAPNPASDSAAASATDNSGSDAETDAPQSTSTNSAASSSGNISDKAPPAYVNPLSMAGGGGAGGTGEGGGGPGGGGGFLGALSRSVALGGQSALLLRVLLASLARRTAGSLGVAGGGEFAAARVAAEAVGAQLVLGDRPVEITLSRAWEALPPGRRAALCWQLLRGALAPPEQALNEELVERLKSDDTVSAFFNALSASYPELVSPLITERDLYLAWSLKRSKAVNGAACVVGVVGRGHLRGVVHALLRDRGGAGLRFTDLVDGKNSRGRRRAQAVQGAVRLGLELALGTAAYLAWLAYTQ